MTSDVPFILKLSYTYDQSLSEHLISNGALPNRLLSPIEETSNEIPSISIPTYIETSQKSPNIVLENDNLKIDELYQKFYQYTINFQNIQNYLNKLNQHFKALTILIESLRNNDNFTDIIQLFDTRLLQMRVKRDQIDHLLNQSSIKNLIQQISPFIQKSKLLIDYNQFSTTIQLSLNQKTVLIDHINNEYRYKKYQNNEYSSKYQQQHQLLIKLTKQINEYFSQHDKLIQQVNHISIYNEHNRQCTELMNLSNEYEQLQNENYLLTLKAKENLQRFSHIMQSNHYHH